MADLVNECLRGLDGFFISDLHPSMCLCFLFPRYGHVAGDGDVGVVSSFVEDVSGWTPIAAALEASGGLFRLGPVR